jgi:hypothetical protein
LIIAALALRTFAQSSVTVIVAIYLGLQDFRLAPARLLYSDGRPGRDERAATSGRARRAG